MDLSEIRQPLPVTNPAGRRKRDQGLKKPSPNPTLVKLGQTVARGNASPLSEVLSPSTLSTSGNQNPKSVSRKRGIPNDGPRVLDGFLLLDWCRVEFPDEVVQAVLSDMHITDVVSEDLLFFTNLARLDMSDNEVWMHDIAQWPNMMLNILIGLQAPLAPFGCLPALAELDFQCNALDEVTLGNGFQSLEVLNLSFNCLGSKGVEELSNLLRIRELYLGNNRIRSLPPIMDRFSRLETLSLESNNISGQEVFSFLTIMPRLRNLNLSHNKITGFPESALVLEDKRGAGFYNLIYLNLAHNMITDEEAVVHTTELRNLRKLILYGNPLAQAAVTSYDPTKLAYDPVPTLTAILDERSPDEIAMTVIVAYPATKKKKLHSMSCYDSVEIYKMIPNEVALQSPFRNRATEFLLGNNPEVAVTDKELLSKRQVPSDTPANPIKKQLRFASNDSTFLTGVGIEDVLAGVGSSAEIPAVPACMISRSLAAESRDFPAMNTRMAMNALRYQLDHPLTSHDDSELNPAHSQRPTQAQLQRQRPRRPLPSRKEQPTSPGRHQNGNDGNDKHMHKGPHGVDDALTQLSHQVASAWDKRSYGAEQGVDKALDSLISTAQKLNLTYNHIQQAPGQTRKA
ncbi:hypothetical protein PHYBOEH_007285 [Phytophthora boehmeriae]|uniref:Uncharacterized protein n=1 Tax=Phytophthora boehmeriae TaxID=109152 RepID=A0A8T1X8P4_9STRA|nr:hypothetical protein PHYBOEH_007285 [Phytophthora boehmeriae]